MTTQRTLLAFLLILAACLLFIFIAGCVPFLNVHTEDHVAVHAENCTIILQMEAANVRRNQPDI